jgi:hypothetical protein
LSSLGVTVVVACEAVLHRRGFITPPNKLSQWDLTRSGVHMLPVRRSRRWPWHSSETALASRAPLAPKPVVRHFATLRCAVVFHVPVVAMVGRMVHSCP